MAVSAASVRNCVAEAGNGENGGKSVIGNPAGAVQVKLDVRDSKFTFASYRQCSTLHICVPAYMLRHRCPTEMAEFSLYFLVAKYRIIVNVTHLSQTLRTLEREYLGCRVLWWPVRREAAINPRKVRNRRPSKQDGNKRISMLRCMSTEKKCSDIEAFNTPIVKDVSINSQRFA
ncbi:hypothetical protein PUN28_009383 [Cardiocondyla obscurior]|uniref:Uncharacterized protein n=1 Tax=Cardiocondyla obscurior TaxID=286306 RepID=A0AAW2FRR6_9HYME